MPKIVIVVPCFDEEARLQPAAFRAAVHRPPEPSFLFVDDGSHDRTRAILEALVRSDPERLLLMPLERNRGKAEAVRQGMSEALRLGADIIGYWDADLATPLWELPGLSDLLRDPAVQVVLGSRVRLLGRKIRRRACRHYLGRIFATCASLILDMPVYDTQCGAKLFRRSPGFEVAIAAPFRTRWIFDVELLARLKVLLPPGGEAWVEQPLRAWEDVGGSRISIRDFIAAPLELLRIYRDLRVKKPEP